MKVSRLLATRVDGPSLKAHRRHHGPLPEPRADLLAEVEASGLLGRGGAGFPLVRKLASVAAGRGPAVVVANGCDGEPASRKDTVLLACAPHLVLDGIQVAARAVRAQQAHLVMHEGSDALAVVRAAVSERQDPVRVEVTSVSGRYVASEETALVNRLNGGPSLPTDTPPRPFERGVMGRATLVSNVETLASLALVARHGAAWYREVGSSAEPGSRLLTVDGPRAEGAAERAQVLELASGTTADRALALAGVDLDDCAAVLVGGWFGTWLDARDVDGLPLSHAGLQAVGGALGAGVLVGLPSGSCGLVATAGIARYLAEQSARQCGPCLNGLPLIASAVTALAHGGWTEEHAPALRRWMQVVPGRGACRHPDGAVRMVASALSVFRDDVAQHAAGRPCPGALMTSGARS